MATRDEIIDFCDTLLAIDSFTDYGPNGLQVPGAAEVTKVASGVSAHRELLQRAVDAGAQLVLAHHGLFWDFHPRALSSAMAERLRIALTHELSVAGYHLPLDAHREIGNNVLVARALGFEPADEPFGVVKGAPIGCVGTHAEGVPADELARRIRETTEREPLHFAFGSERVHRIGVVTGAGSSEIHAAIELGLDALVTGEPAEHVMADAREGGIHFFGAGHYATETFGIKRLGELIAERFGVEHEFIDVPNPV